MEKLLKNKKALIIAIVAIIAVVGVVIGLASMETWDTDVDNPVVYSVETEEKEEPMEEEEEPAKEETPTKADAPIIGGFEYDKTLSGTTYEEVALSLPYIDTLFFFVDGEGVASWKTEDGLMTLEGEWKLDEKNSNDKMLVYTFATETEGTAIIYYYFETDVCSVIYSDRNAVSFFTRIG